MCDQVFGCNIDNSRGVLPYAPTITETQQNKLNLMVGMTIKELLLQEIESSPESLLEETLDFLRSLKKNEETFPTNIPKLHISPDNLSDSSQLPYHPASGRSILRHAGTWEGDDFQECLELVYNTRGKAKFDYNFHDA